jgi:hypothetical protein
MYFNGWDPQMFANQFNQHIHPVTPNSSNNKPSKIVIRAHGGGWGLSRDLGYQKL